MYYRRVYRLMTNEKQVLELRDKIAHIHRQFLEDDTAECQYLDSYIAENLYEIGYRKASEVVREIIDLIDGWFMYCEKYSGHIIKSRLAELKKKYESEEEE